MINHIEELNRILNDNEASLRYLVDAFREKYPDSEFGHGHVVISDYNWDSITFCLRLINEEANAKGIYKRAAQNITLTDEEKELLETEKFLYVLRTIAHYMGIMQI